MLKIEGLEAGYGDVQVLWGVDMEVKAGEIVSLVGSNGAGKTSLLSTVSGLVPVWKGHLSLNGEELGRLRSDQIVARGVIHVPEGRHLFAGMTVEDNLLMGAYGRKNGVKEDLERVYQYFPVLAERRKQLAGKMSGGEQQMCAIGRGLLARPKLMMVDELSLGLAPVVTEKLFSILQQINKDGVALLLVEQDVQWALEIAHRAYVLERGKVVLSGTAEEIRSTEMVRTAYLGL